MRKKIIVIGSLCVLLSLTGCGSVWNAAVENTAGNTAQQSDETVGNESAETDETSEDEGKSNAAEYENAEYGFRFTLPDSWEGYTVITDSWEGQSLEQLGNGNAEEGPMISLRHPEWTAEQPRQDIPIMILTIAQWDALQTGKFHIGAAPIGPKELGRNHHYVFALPARYNFAFPLGYEEVEDILSKDPLQPMEQQ